MFYVRKVTVAKWHSDEIAQGKIPADAVTVDLCTKDNALSFWRCPSGREEETEKIALAIAAKGTSTSKVNLVLIPEEHFENHFMWRDTRSDTPYEEIADQHCDLIALDGELLMRVASVILDAISKKDQIHTIRERKIKGLMEKAVKDGLVAKEKLSDKWQKKISV